MPDLNNLLENVKSQSLEAKKCIEKLFMSYDALFREGNSKLITERQSSGGMTGLEDFYTLVHIVRRNRDVVGSLVRGLKGIRSLDGFSFIEEDEPNEPEVNRAALEKIEVSEAPMTQGENNA